MSKFIKYALAVATLLIACATFALADEPATVATVNGRPFSSLETALSEARSGDYVRVVADTSFSSSLLIPQGVTMDVPRGVTITTVSNGLLSRGFLNIYGRFVRTGDVSSPGAFISVLDGITNFYGQVVSTHLVGAGFVVSNSNGSPLLNIYGGSVIGSSSSVLNVSNDSSIVNIYSGSFSPMVDLNKVNLHGGHVVGNSVSWGGLYELGQIVSESISWIGLFCAAIVANKLLLLFLIFVLGFVAIGLIKRLINN